MGFFKSLGKIIGGVAKVGLKVASLTPAGNLLDKAASVAKTLGLRGGVKHRRDVRNADYALATKLVPKMSVTTVNQDAQTPIGVRSRTPTPLRRRRVNAMPGTGRTSQGGAVSTPAGTRSARRRAPSAPEGRTMTLTRRRRRKPSSSGAAASSKPKARRTLSPSMAERAAAMKQLGAQWREKGGAAGVGMSWRQFVKANLK